MRDTVEVYVYLHGQKHGMTTVSRAASIVGKVELPTNLLEFSTAQERGPGWILLRLPRFLANEYALVRSSQDGQVNVEKMVLDGLTRSLEEYTRTESAPTVVRLASDGPNEQSVPKRSLLTPARPLASTHVLDQAKAKSISAQLAEQNLDT